MRRLALVLLAAALVPSATPQTFPSARGSWLRLADDYAADRRNSEVTLLLDGRVAVSGGATAVIDLFDPVTNRISRGPSDTRVRKSHTATRLLDGRILFAGGEYFDSSCSIYDPAAGTVVPTGSMNVGRQKHTATLLPDGKVLVTGGGSPNVGPFIWLSSCEIFDPAAGTWSPAGNLLVPRADHMAVLLPNGKVLVDGGYESTDLSRADLYDPATATSAPAYWSWSKRYAAVSMPDGRILIVDNRGGELLGKFYDWATGTFTTAFHVYDRAGSPAVGLFPNGSLIFAGGATVLYDFETRRSRVSDAPLRSRYYPDGVMLPDGRFLIAGDYSIAEIFDPRALGVTRGDCDDDGRADILWHHPETMQTTFWHMEGVIAAGGENRQPFAGNDVRWHLEATLDVFGGGRTNLVWRHTVDTEVAWRTDSYLRPPSQTQSYRAHQPHDWSIVAGADFDGNGREEMVWRRRSGEIEIWATENVDGFVSFRTFMADADFVIAAADDFDGDGRGDVLWRHLVRGENYIWFMDGDATRHTHQVARAGHTTPVTDMNYSVAGTGDFDGDGKADIVWRSVFGPTRIWFMNGVTITNDVAVPAPGAGWNVAVIGDFDGDGKSDVFWRNPATGENAVTLFDGFNVKAASSLPAVTEAGWITMNPGRPRP